jgi:ribonuclease PH
MVFMMMNKKIERLHKLALKAAVAREKLEEALAKAQRDRNWVPICIAEGIDPHANAGDWMC